MKNREIAGILFNVSTLLDEQGGNPYRIRAYRRAARSLLRLGHEVSEHVASGEDLGVPFIGKRLTLKITELARDGHADFYDELCSTLPAAQDALLHVPGIGPHLAKRITSAIHADNSPELIRLAAMTGLQRVPGIGPKRAARILDGLATAAPAAPLPVTRVGNILYVQESLWGGDRSKAA